MNKKEKEIMFQKVKEERYIKGCLSPLKEQVVSDFSM